LVEVARRRGFTNIEVIDDDLGRTASGAVERPGFDRLVAALCAGQVGAVLCLDASRLARNGRDWHHLLELCGLVEARVIDLDGVYDPCRPNDRLLLGMKGSISEFELGIIRAIGRNQGQTVATHELRTAGKPARLVLAADRSKIAPDWDDVVYVTASVVDENGVLVPGADQLVTFRATGPGVIAAVDSADNASHEPFQASERHAFQGQCLAIVKANAGAGRIAVTASSPDLAAATVNIEAGGK